MQTLSPQAAHNAVAAVVEMYAGAIADLMRVNAMLQQQITEARTEITKLREAMVESERVAQEDQSPRNADGNL